jgi:hypothetical protein
MPANVSYLIFHHVNLSVETFNKNQHKLMNYTKLKICLLVLLEIQNPSLKQYPICARKDKIFTAKLFFLKQLISVFFYNN